MKIKSRINRKSTQLIAGKLLGFIVKKLVASQISKFLEASVIFCPCDIGNWCRLKFCYHGFHDSWLNNIRQIDVCLILIVSKFLSLGGICRPIQRRNDRRERT